jgi:hypothetical protein
VLVQRAVSEDPRWTRAVGDPLGRPQGNGYQLAEIADYLGVHASTVSCRLKPSDQADARLQDPTSTSSHGGLPVMMPKTLGLHGLL